MPRLATPEELGLSQEDYSYVPSAQPTKVETLADRKQEKISKLSSKVGLSPQDQSNQFVTSEDGYVDHMGNKIANEYTPEELQYLVGRTYKEEGVFETPDGYMTYQGDELVPYAGSSEDLATYYGFGTKGDEGVVKTGTWGGLDPKDRYSNEYLARYGQKVGPEGVDATQEDMRLLLPKDRVKFLENLQHGNEYVLANREARQKEGELEEYQKDKERLGSGTTEFYKDGYVGAFGGAGDVTNIQNTEALWEGFQEKYGLGQVVDRAEPQFTADEYQERYLEREADDMGVFSRLANTVGGGLTMLTKELGVDLADAIGEGTGLWDLGSEEDKLKWTSDLFNYNYKVSEGASKEASEYSTNILEAIKDDKKDVSMGDVWGLMKVGFTTPEYLGESIGTLAGMLVGFGKFTKAGKAIGLVEEDLKKGNITNKEAKAQVADIKKSESMLNKASRISLNNAGFAAVVTGNVNDRLDEFMEANDGEYSLTDVARITMGETLIAGVDRYVDLAILKNTPIGELLKGPLDAKKVKEIAQDMDAQSYIRATQAVAKGAGKLTAAGMVEGATEYAQTLGEIFNARYATEQYGDDIGEILAADDAQIEAIAGAGIGSAIGVEMSAIGQASDRIQGQEVTSKIRESITSRNQKVPEDLEVTKEAVVEAEAANSQVANDVWEQLVALGAQDRIQGGQLNQVNLRELTSEDLSDSEWSKIADTLARVDKQNVASVLATMQSGGKVKEAQVLAQKILERDPANWSEMGSDPSILRDTITVAAVNRLEADDSPVAVRENIQRGLGRQLDDATIDSIVQEAVQEVEYARTLKSSNEVSQEATSGPRGFMTYYSKARYGDTPEVRERAVASLSKFLDKHELKKEIVDEAKIQIQSELNREALKLINNMTSSLKNHPAYRRAPAILKTSEYEPSLLEMTAYAVLAERLASPGVRAKNTVQVDYGAKNERGEPYAFPIGKYTVAEELHDALVSELQEVAPELDQRYKVVDKPEGKNGYLTAYRGLTEEVASMGALLSNLVSRQAAVGEPVEIESAKESASIAEYAAPEPLMKPIEEVAEPAELPTSMLPDEDIPTSIPQQPTTAEPADIDMSNLPQEEELDVSQYEELVDAYVAAEAEAETEPTKPKVVTEEVKARIGAKREAIKQQIKEVKQRSKEYNDWTAKVDAAEVEVAKEIANRPAYAKQLVSDTLGDEFFQELVDNRIAKLREKEPNRDYSRTEAALINQYANIQLKLEMKLVELGCK